MVTIVHFGHLPWAVRRRVAADGMADGMVLLVAVVAVAVPVEDGTPEVEKGPPLAVAVASSEVAAAAAADAAAAAAG